MDEATKIEIKVQELQLEVLEKLNTVTHTVLSSTETTAQTMGTEGSSKPTRQLYIFPTRSVKRTRYTDSMPDANFLWLLAPNGLNI